MLLSAIAAPASALAASGGAGLSSASSGTSSSGATQLTANGVTVQTVSGSGLTFSSRTAGLRGGTMWFSGTGGSGQALVIQRQSGANWVTVADTTAGSGGTFTVAWQVNAGGNFAVRVASANGSAASPSIPVVIYKRSIATEYGPGFYGHKTACGTVLRKATVGVANRTLPCGASVSIFYRGRTVVVPVIDRGPYANNANWDLTMATGRALGITGTTNIGAITVSAQYRPLR